MIARGFKSVIWTMTVGGAALACYMVSLQVATERADLASVERQIIAAKGEIRTLQTELGTRGRLSQLEQWNAEVLALSAPTSAQFLQDEVKLARFEQADPTLEERSAEVRMASAETGAAPAKPAAPAAPVVQAVGPAPAASAPPVVRRASFTAEAPRANAAAAPSREPVKMPVQQAKAEPKAADKAKDSAKAASKSREAATAPASAKPAPAKAQAKAAPEKARTSKIDGKLAAEIKTGSGSEGN